MLDQVGLVGLFTRGPLAQGVEFGLFGAAVVFEIGEAAAYAFGPGIGDLVAIGDGAGFAFVEQVVLAAGDIGDRLLDRGDPLLDVVAIAGVVAPELMAQQRGAVAAEHALVEEGFHAVEQPVFAHVHRAGVVGVGAGVTDTVELGLAGVVRQAFAGFAEHPFRALPVVHVVPQHVGPARGRVGVLAAHPRSLPGGGDLLHRCPHLPADQRLVGRFGGPDPFLGGIEPSAFLGGSPVPHHEPGVFRVDQDLPHRRHRPASFCPRTAIGAGWRVAVQIRVQPLRDHLVGEAFVVTPLIDPHHCRGTLGVNDQPGLGAAFFAFGCDRVRDVVVEVAVAGFADVPALFGVFAESFPGLFEGVTQKPFAHTLFHSPDQDLRGPFLGQRDRSFVGGEQRHAYGFQLVFELGGLMRPPRGAFDLLDHDRLEPPVRVPGLGQQIGQAPVTGDRDVERLVRMTQATLVQIFARGLHVVEERDDHELRRQHLTAVVQLTRQRQGRVLQVTCRGPQEHRHRHLLGPTDPHKTHRLACRASEFGHSHAARS
nr:hypothetical protein [Nocardia coffeae]